MTKESNNTLHTPVVDYISEAERSDVIDINVDNKSDEAVLVKLQVMEFLENHYDVSLRRRKRIIEATRALVSLM